MKMGDLLLLSLLQVRRLLRTEGLTGNGGGRKRQQRRGSSDDEDDDGWDSTPEGGDVLLGVDKQHLERLYQQHLAEEDYVQKVCYGSVAFVFHGWDLCRLLFEGC
jgi:hypothetical protein